MTFAASRVFWLLLIVVPPLIGFYWWSWRKRQQLMAQFTSERLLGLMKIGVSPTRQKIRMALIVVAVILLIFALARPQWGFIREEARQRGLDIIVAIDTSNSMLAEDVLPNRLARAQLAALDLMHKARTDRMGLIAFAGSAFLQCPLTLDDAAFSQSVDSLDTQTISQGGTAIGEAIDEASKAFKKEADNHKVLVLFTDGEDHDSDAIDLAKKAAKEGIVIFTIGIGTAEGELLRIKDERGRVDYIRDEQGKPVKSRLDEETLQQIARVTKGFYLPLRGTKTIDSLYDQGIAPLPKTETAVKMFQRYHERFHWFIALAIALLILEIFLPDRKRRRRSARPVAAPNTVPPVVTTAIIILFLLTFAAATQASPSSALREYNNGSYQDAFKDYNKLLDKKDDPRLHFNAGAAAYQSRHLEDAAREFNSALASPDVQMQQRSYYNLGNTLYRIGQQVPDPEKKQEAWENSMKGYESALKLNPADADAKYNQAYVKNQLEELKKQQQQQQNQDKKDQDKKQDKKDQKDQNQKNQDQKSKDQQSDQKDQQKDQQDKQNQDSSQNQKKDSQSKQDQEKKDQDKQNQKEKKKDEQPPDQKDQDKPGEKPKDKSQEEAEQEAAAMAAGQMTPKQAEQLLESQKDDDKVLRLAPPNKNVSQSRAYKNW